MGGGTSRFEETNWDAASGKLVSNRDTIDGASPTRRYSVYTLLKRGVNQRDFDIVDQDGNLHYTTRCIEGTLAWFDVLGPGMDQFLLRVQVDLSRRYWVIYRYGCPSYPIQFADMLATERLRLSRGEHQPCLYKRSCITVTWSRFYAIVNNYGPPPGEYDDQTDEIEEEEEEEEIKDDGVNGYCSSSPTNTATTTTITPSEELTLEAKTSQDQEEYQAGWQPKIVDECQLRTQDDMPTPAWLSPSQVPTRRESNINNTLDSQVNLQEERKVEREMSLSSLNFKPSGSVANEDSTNTLSILFSDENGNTKAAESPSSRVSGILPKSTIERLQKWYNESSEGPNPLEGFLQLDKPILKVEEINSFVGQHQSMLIGVEEAKKLEKETIEDAAKMGADARNPNANLGAGMTETATEGSAGQPAAPAAETTYFPRIKKFANWVRTSQSRIESGSFTTSANNDSSDSVNPFRRLSSLKFQVARKEEVEEIDFTGEDSLPNPSSLPSTREGRTRLERDPSAQLTDFLGDATAKEEENKKKEKEEKADPKEPLVGFWAWESNLRINKKMTLHVAEGSDLALHVVLAIVTNQLRLERNVVVSTV